MSFRWRFLWGLVAVSLALVALCTWSAISLIRQQASVAAAMQKNVTRWRNATELEECLDDILVLLKNRVESVAALHGRTLEHLDTIRKLADHTEEKDLAQRLDQSFNAYLDVWRIMPPVGKPGHERAVKQAVGILENDMLKASNELVVFNRQRMEDETQSHDQVLRQLAWGIASVSGLGGIAGLVLGFGIARGLKQTIQRLHVKIRDAAGRLGPKLPEIVLTGEGDLAGLHEQMELLTQRIEAVVEQLQRRESEMLRTEQLAAVGQLAAGVAHEIRNPLTSIKLLVQAGMEDDGASALSAEDLRVIEQEIRRMEGSLNTFLNLARPPKLQRRPVDLGGLVQNVLGLVRGRLEKQGIDVKSDLPAEPILLTADGEQLQQVLVNLVLNSLDAMPSGGTLSIAVRSGLAGEIELRVTDTGVGITAEVLPKLFQPFMSGKETGLGLGLFISRRIVENHGGAIHAETKSTGGASFVVKLPSDGAPQHGQAKHATATVLSS